MSLPDLDRLARALLIVILDSAVRASVVAAVIGVAIHLLRGRGAALQLKAWTVVLWAALALPALGLVVPAWQWVIPVLQVAPSQPAAFGTAATVAATATDTALPATVGPVRVSGLVFVGALYVAGLMLLLLQAGLAWVTTRRLRLSARPIVDEGLLARLDRHASAAGLRSRPIVVESSRLFVPITMSVMRPMVALPADWRDWPADKLDAVLIHEVAHVARRDALTQRVSLFYRAVMWVSPFSWWLHRHIAHLAEQASDEAALRAGVTPTTYAETLLDCFAKLQRQPRRVQWHVAMARRADADAARRMERILTWKGGRMIMRPKIWLVGLVLVALPVAAVTASVRLSPVVPQPPTPAAPPAMRAPAVAPLPAASSVQVPSAPALPAPVQSAPATRPATSGSQAVPQQSGRPVGVEPQDDFAAGAYDVGTPGLVVPKVLSGQKPRYTPDALKAKLEGTVVIEAIVLPDGSVGKARVTRSLDQVLGLDDEALAAAMKWSFISGKLNGESVPVRIVLELQFRIH